MNNTSGGHHPLLFNSDYNNLIRIISMSLNSLRLHKALGFHSSD